MPFIECSTRFFNVPEEFLNRAKPKSDTLCRASVTPKTTGAHESFAASLPVVRLGTTVVIALSVGHADGGRQ
jgi:hypothetical protein